MDAYRKVVDCTEANERVGRRVHFFTKDPYLLWVFFMYRTPNIMGLFYVHQIPNIMGLFVCTLVPYLWDLFMYMQCPFYYGAFLCTISLHALRICPMLHPLYIKRPIINIEQLTLLYGTILCTVHT